MASIDHACRRITAAIDEIERLRESDFPYPHAREALVELDRMFRAQLDVLRRIPEGAAVHVTNNACSASLYQLFVYVPILGFILRSTNVRNAFEAYSPLLRLARSLLGRDTKLILSSEWDYSPFVYMPMTDLPGFVLIGLPAPESANPLLVPLAGHELGHWLWQAANLGRISPAKRSTSGRTASTADRARSASSANSSAPRRCLKSWSLTSFTDGLFGP